MSDQPPIWTQAPKRPWWKKDVPLWGAILTGLLGIAIGAAGATGEDEPTETAATVETTTTTERQRRTTTTARATTTTRRETTTTAEPTTTTTTAPPQPVEVGRFQGASDTETNDMTVVGTWSITGTATGGAGINIAIRAPGGDLIDSTGIDADAGQQTSQFRQGGTFYLEISTFGSTYDVQVVDLPG